jgi:riboflavin biosynthesis pyrimidine reductase
MKVIMFMAMSVNGKIADNNGSEDFLSNKNWQAFTSIANKTGCVVWGRKTYDAVMKWDKKYLNALKSEIIVVSFTGNVKNPKEAINYAKRKKYSTIILSGGSTLNKSFMEQNLVDEIILDVEPAILGEGKNLVEEGRFFHKLKLLKITEIGRDIVQLRYKVLK